MPKGGHDARVRVLARKGSAALTAAHQVVGYVNKEQEMLLVAVRKSLIAGAAALCMACLPLAVTGIPAQASVAGTGTGTGTVEHWGTFLGGGTTEGRTDLKPVAVKLPGAVAEIGTSNSTQYALLANGEVYAWGQGSHGQLGNGGSQGSAVPVRVRFPAGVKIASIPTDTMPYDSGLAIDTHGHAWGWGSNSGGEFCLGNIRAHKLPVRLPFSGVKLLAGAADHATYDADGTLYSCGTNQDGELGDGSKRIVSLVPVKVKDLAGSSVAALVASYGNTGALLHDGQYYDWGFDGAGQLGNGTTRQQARVPVHVSLPGPVTDVTEGGSLPTNGQTLVKLSDGALYAWGDDSFGQLGDGTKGHEPTPVRFYARAGVTYQTLASGGSTSYAISTTGQVYAWGASSGGQVGDGTRKTALQPVLVESGATSISSTADDVDVSVS